MPEPLAHSGWLRSVVLTTKGHLMTDAQLPGRESWDPKRGPRRGNHPETALPRLNGPLEGAGPSRAWSSPATSSPFPLLPRDLEPVATALRALDALHVVRCRERLDDGHADLLHHLLRGNVQSHRRAPNRADAEL